MAFVEYDAIGEEREERRSAVESLASLVYGLVLAYLWFVVALFVFVPLIALVAHAF